MLNWRWGSVLAEQGMPNKALDRNSRLCFAVVRDLQRIRFALRSSLVCCKPDSYGLNVSVVRLAARFVSTVQAIGGNVITSP